MKKNKIKTPPIIPLDSPLSYPSWTRFGRTLVPWASALLLGLWGMWQFHNSEFYSNFALVPGGRGDSRLVTAVLEYIHQALHGTGRLLSPAFYYPTRGTLGYADVFLTYAVMFEGLRSAGWNVFSSLQACLLATDLLNYLCCFLLLRKGLRLGVFSSGLGAFLFAFNAPKFNQTGHVQLQCLFWLPLIFWCLVEFVKKSKKIEPLKAFGLLALAALFLNIQFLSSFYVSWFFIFWFCLFLLLCLLVPSTRSFLLETVRRHGRPLGGAAAFFVIGLIPFFIIYLPIIREMGGREYGEVESMTPNLWSYLWMGPRHGWWGWLWDACPSIRAFPIEGEQRLGFGAVVPLAWAALTWAAMGLLRGKNRWAKGNLTYDAFAALLILATTLFFLLAFQYPGGISPWWLVYKTVPGAEGIRALSRMVLFLALPMAIALAFACHVMMERAGEAKGRAKILLGGLVFLAAGIMVWEQSDLPPFPAFNKILELNRLESLSQKLPDTCKVFYATVDPGLPYTATDIQIDAMLISAARGIPTLNGYSGQSPPHSSWGLFKVRSPKYRQYVRDWIKLNRIREPVCELRIDR